MSARKERLCNDVLFVLPVYLAYIVSENLTQIDKSFHYDGRNIPQFDTRAGSYFALWPVCSNTLIYHDMSSMRLEEVEVSDMHD